MKKINLETIKGFVKKNKKVVIGASVAIVAMSVVTVSVLANSSNRADDKQEVTTLIDTSSKIAESISKAKLESEKLVKEKTESESKKKAESESLAKEKAESESKLKAESESLAQAESESIEQASIQVEQQAQEVVVAETQSQVQEQQVAIVEQPVQETQPVQTAPVAPAPTPEPVAPAPTPEPVQPPSPPYPLGSIGNSNQWFDSLESATSYGQSSWRGYYTFVVEWSDGSIKWSVQFTD